MKISRYNTIKKYKNQILVYNSYTKASIFLTLDSNTLAFENIEEFNKLEMNFQKLLVENGFVLENSKDELSELKYIFEKSYFDNDFLNIVLVPSLACNFKCKNHCKLCRTFDMASKAFIYHLYIRFGEDVGVWLGGVENSHTLEDEGILY